MRTMISSSLAAVVLVAGMMSVGCRAPRTDQTAINTEDTGQYEVLAETQPEPRVYDLRVRVQNLDKSTDVARDLAHRMAVFSPLRVRIHILGPADAPDAAPRQTLRWPEELDYRER